MPHISTDDGVKLYYEEAGSGTPVVFVHEFAATTAAGSLSFATSRGATDASPSMRAAGRPRRSPRPSPTIRRRVRVTTSARSWMA
jgi:hypothetical protein